jgi:hypothetical protein
MGLGKSKSTRELTVDPERKREWRQAMDAFQEARDALPPLVRRAGEWCDNDEDPFTNEDVNEIKDPVTFVIGDRFECVDRAQLREWFDHGDSTVRAVYTQHGRLGLVNRQMAGVDNPNEPDITFFRLPLASGERLLFAADVDAVVLVPEGARRVWHARPVGTAYNRDMPWRRVPVFALKSLDSALVSDPDSMPGWLEPYITDAHSNAAADLQRARELYAAERRAFGAARPQ